MVVGCWIGWWWWVVELGGRWSINFVRLRGRGRGRGREREREREREVRWRKKRGERKNI